MGQFMRRYWLLIGLILLIAPGCLRSATSEELEISGSRIMDTLTPQPTATFTFLPSPTSPSVASPTPLLYATLPAVSTPGIPPMGTSPQPIQGVPLTVLSTPIPQQPSETLHPSYLAATQLVGTTTQQWLDLTATVQGQLYTVPTFTPTMTFPPFQTTPIPMPTLPGTDCIHEVVAGENLYRLSIRYGVAIMDIAYASGIAAQDVERLSIGQRLTIPRCGTTGVVPPPTTAPSPAPGTSVPGAYSTAMATPFMSTGSRIHRVQQGETLFTIAQDYGVSMDDIIRLNNITNPDLIYFNQELTIP